MTRLINILKRWKNVYILFIIVFFAGVFGGVLFRKGGSVQSNSDSEYYGSIFLNNLDVGLLCLIGGLFTCGAIPIFVMCMNGYVVGNTINSLIIKGNIESLFTGLLPHFFIELFGLLSFSVLGTFTGVIFLRFLQGEIRKVNYLKMIREGFIMLFIATSFLFLGAIIEDFVSWV
ncbi:MULTISPECIES: stage II sporulation protein M [Bacillus]|uniref:stage II sporulation protein M n=1 Tax=Bacillus TaxID=1386 RepID=UPI000BF56F74|nr:MULTISPECIES: stage II sporulation protein M [Bacillus]MCM3366668.1 stage II sporulation protein M [Bacillus safensis]MCY7479129.1 stage II sporulation protein M [Bacillus safensis]MCY7512650.1 stage II sporulation protein M [Bacillus safensis]MCY7541929.1 stage II sporulation protein M [Bacillus safensis]MCY7549717.1 stage II sporulation protein M [Bacillus safensis]